MDTNKIQLVQVRMSTGELSMLNDLSEKVYGGARRSDVVRRVIAERFNKAFPIYLRAKKGNSAVGVPPEELTDDQFCEKWGGKVYASDAGPKCVIGNWEMMLTDRENIQKRGKQLVEIKNLKKQ